MASVGFLHHPRPWIGFGVGTGLVVLVTLTLRPFHADVPAEVPALVLVLPVVVAGVIGGRLAAIVVSVEGALALALGFLAADTSVGVFLEEDLVALVVFLVVAAVVGGLVGTVAAADRQRVRAEEARVQALQEIDRARTGLLRSVSHDLRTPLATIRAAATDLRSGIEYDQATRDELLDLMGSEAERLDRIVANLLSLSRIEFGTFQPDLQSVDLEELVRASTERLERVLNGLRIELEVASETPLVLADYTQIDQVLSNLLENAARHSPAGAPIRVTVSPEGAPVPAAVVVSVTDEGSGVDPALRDHLFEPFQGSRQGASTGIGLAICRTIVEAHGGTITAGDAAGGGARFSFTLPVALPTEG